MIETQREVNGVIITERVWDEFLKDTINKVILKGQCKELLENDATYNPHIEVCSLLIGKGNIVKYIYHTENIDQSPVHFTISSEQLMRGYKIAANLDLDVIGIFHSHPNNMAWPSVTDERFMKTNPGIWIIYSGTGKNMKAFVLDENEKPKEIKISRGSGRSEAIRERHASNQYFS